jgi:hypothetical protein
MTQTVPIEVAGRLITDPLEIFAAYCRRSHGTVRHYDWLAGTAHVLTPELVKATRSPWMGSRISECQERHLLDLSESAPWQDVPIDARLQEADPAAPHGLYAYSLRLYNHFFIDRPPELGHAKVSKCLHLMRPSLFPILDSRLLRLYRVSAERAAKELQAAGVPDAPPRRAYWAAYRRDVVRAEQGLETLRAVARDQTDPITVEAAERLSDVRIVDILAWSRSGDARIRTDLRGKTKRE